MTEPIHLAVALDGVGWHPAAWREECTRPREIFTAGYWARLVAEAERGLLDFVTFEDALGLQSTLPDGVDGRTDQVRGRLDAVLIAARVAPLTTRIGLIPTATTTHTEPFHVAMAIATLDHVSRGRAGWRVRVSPGRTHARHFGRRDFPRIERLPAPGDGPVARHIRELFDEAADAVEVARRLWDSWEDDAEIRDVATGRFIDRDKLHYIDFSGRWFSVKGPAITPRPPQGQPLVTALAHARIPYEFAARSADVVYVTPHTREEAAAVVRELREIPRDGDPLKIFADLVVFLGPDAAARKARLDDLDGAEFTSDAAVFTGTVEELADLLEDWRRAGIEGYRLRPGVIPHDLKAITRGLTAALRRRGLFRSAYEAPTLRGLLGLGRPVSRYARAVT
ncbi:FMNH2-utilizing oxygenase [Thermobispora bispora]|jgi:alkanesulfonate monooxygenase SsuD/methylene tetrahydromethanopterin reductase-like flavin-dependent oxidoreductase (luciferase family)|uniref:Xenobiotic compound DszA family monooxygenase n=1 Tax=Thermobispora bispora (strain ATCC 19993 / DSM 43833 / CBS 139.67 / JCM 10125 / KCTC 9307 / NBRC 14880 / R51) TaxID=469371 RepID=D6YAU0_THEBD|nr:LLM class flavin-dependent oxidoreductase [Thermobispora bispora]MBO2474911.1 LLM class flavin-dependent oxidoreductase [Actinomycetales bacterium]MDI9580284.1 LLM class flavin-dependent oxidoreductase [Thermobispora sp.]ADG88307.1 xenobiotic compound DszA family monooxygenase [Thermobispora bispora DSM 43833]MBX6168629.1 LLM class flavin-dependent oxidoreductase [Thermobispora bispora]QSI48131.1 LLM class flavin-dependent oxidoreductase [Thermobispora bispora]